MTPLSLHDVSEVFQAARIELRLDAGSFLRVSASEPAIASSERPTLAQEPLSCRSLLSGIFSRVPGDRVWRRADTHEPVLQDPAPPRIQGPF